MKAKLLEITRKARQDAFACVAPSDFATTFRADVDLQQLLDPRVTLYCVDHARQCALFVETPPGLDLAQAPFYYEAQYTHATRLYEVPYAALHALADSLSPDTRKVVLVYSVGRTGSTLISAVLNALDGVVGLAEPDVFTQLVALRDFNGSNSAEIAALARSCLRLQCKPSEAVTEPRAWVLKLRSFGIELGDLLHTQCGGTRNIFLYRDLNSWLHSAGRAFLRTDNELQFREHVQALLSGYVPSVARHVEEGGALLSSVALGTHAWLGAMERYLDLRRSGVPMLALRYADIVAAPAATLGALLEYCGLPQVDVTRIEAVLERDSQAGTALSQETLANRAFSLSAEEEGEAARLLASRPEIRTGDHILPGTWMPRQA